MTGKVVHVKDVAGADHVGAAEKDDAVAIGVGCGRKHDLIPVRD